MIREAKVQDSEKIANIIVSAWKYAFSDIVDRSYAESMDVKRFVQIMENNLQQKKETIFVFEDNAQIKGFISGKLLNESEYDCETVGLYILPEFQNQGIGKMLFQHLQKIYAALTCRRMIVWTLKGAKNNSFYKRNGGIFVEEKMLEFGDKEYPGIGVLFNLTSRIN